MFRVDGLSVGLSMKNCERLLFILWFGLIF